MEFSLEVLHSSYEIRDVSMTESYIEESIYQASPWSKPRRIIQSICPAGELFIRMLFSR